MCGIIAFVGNSTSGASVHLSQGLQALAHRGQQGCRIVVYGFGIWQGYDSLKGVEDITGSARHLRGSMGIGHTRYPTSGHPASLANVQPFYYPDLEAYFAHNGNVFGWPASLIVPSLDKSGHVSDSRILMEAFFSFWREAGLDWIGLQSAVKKIHQTFKGAYSCVVVSPQFGVIAFRDPYGIRPLEWAVNGVGEVVIASETVAFPQGFESQGYIRPGGVLWWPLDGSPKYASAGGVGLIPCAFEYVYFAHPDSILNGVPVRKVRQTLGTYAGLTLKARYPDKSFLVTPVPRTSYDIAPSLAEVGGWEYREDVITLDPEAIHKRAFLASDTQSRRKIARDKHHIQVPLTNKPLVLVDDSIVRGNTLPVIIEEIRKQFTGEIYVVSACPPILYPDYYGIAMPTQEELIAYGCPTHDIGSYVASKLGVDGVVYVSKADLVQSIRGMHDWIREPTMPYLDGNYINGYPEA